MSFRGARGGARPAAFAAELRRSPMSAMGKCNRSKSHGASTVASPRRELTRQRATPNSLTAHRTQTPSTLDPRCPRAPRALAVHLFIPQGRITRQSQHAREALAHEAAHERRPPAVHKEGTGRSLMAVAPCVSTCCVASAACAGSERSWTANDTTIPPSGVVSSAKREVRPHVDAVVGGDRREAAHLLELPAGAPGGCWSCRRRRNRARRENPPSRRWSRQARGSSSPTPRGEDPAARGAPGAPCAARAR